jgi:hypothetical protein
MNDLISKLLGFIGDPVIATILIGFVIAIGIIWKLFSQQHAFIKERLDLLHNENIRLREQVQRFEEENKKLRESNLQFQFALKTLREQPLLTREHLEAVKAISETQLSLPYKVGQVVTTSIKNLDELLVELRGATLESGNMVYQGLQNLNMTLQESFSTKQLAEIVNDLINEITRAESERLGAIEKLQDRLQQQLKAKNR